MGHQQPLTPVARENTAANSIMNGTEKQERLRVIKRNGILLVQRQNTKKSFPHILGGGK